MNNKNNISDAELSLITAISSLDNKLEELDHNVKLLSEKAASSAENSIDETKLSKKIEVLESEIAKLDHKINNLKEFDKGKKYLYTLPSKGRFSNQKKGYVLAENLRLKRIESLEQSLKNLITKFGDEESEPQILKAESSEILKRSNELNISSEEEFYSRSKGMFFGFIFSIILVFLLIIVSTGANIFI